MMYDWLKRLLWLNKVRPITHLDVAAAPRDPEAERLMKKARGRKAMSIIDLERTSWEVRQELAGNVLHIVSGDHHGKGTNS